MMVLRGMKLKKSERSSCLPFVDAQVRAERPGEPGVFGEELFLVWQNVRGGVNALQRGHGRAGDRAERDFFQARSTRCDGS